MLYTKMMHLCSNSSLVQKYTDLFKLNFDSLVWWPQILYSETGENWFGNIFKPKKKDEAQ